jgi:hypothetical protein
MSTRGPRYSNEEFARRGGAIYKKDISPRLRPGDDNKFVAIDIETGDYEVDSDDYTGAANGLFHGIVGPIPGRRMITGRVTARLEAIVQLRVQMVTGESITIEGIP